MTRAAMHMQGRPTASERATRTAASSGSFYLGGSSRSTDRRAENALNAWMLHDTDRPHHSSCVACCAVHCSSSQSCSSINSLILDRR